MKCLLPFLLFSQLLLAGSGGSAPHRLWKWSLLALATGAVTDTTSTFGRKELNPFLAGSGSFSTSSVLIKSGVSAGIVMGSFYIKSRGHEKLATTLNFSSAALWGGAAIHNWTLKERK